MNNICPFQAGELLSISGNARIFLILKRELLLQAVFEAGQPLIVVWQIFALYLIDTFFELAFLADLLIPFFAQRQNLITECRDGSTLLIQPQ